MQEPKPFAFVREVNKTPELIQLALEVYIENPGGILIEEFDQQSLEIGPRERLVKVKLELNQDPGSEPSRELRSLILNLSTPLHTILPKLRDRVEIELKLVGNAAPEGNKGKVMLIYEDDDRQDRPHH